MLSHLSHFGPYDPPTRLPILLDLRKPLDIH